MKRLQDRVALITGAARGQGAAEAQLFAEEGATVVVADVLDGEGENTAKSIGGSCVYRRLDVTSEADWAAVIGEIDTQHGRLDVLVNNAGIVKSSPIEHTSLDDFMQVIDVNQVGVFLGMRAVAPIMKRNGRGAIVNISSIDGIIGMAGVASYVSSKFAVRGMTKVGALEWGPVGIRVNSIHPAGVVSPMTEPRFDDAGNKVFDIAESMSRVPLLRMCEAEEVAKLALFLASDESSYCTGSEFVIDGGWLAGASPTGFMPPT